MKRAVIITNIPTPYRIPLFNEIDRQLEEQGIKLTVLFGATGYARRKWDLDMAECRFDYRVLPSREIRLGDVEKTSFTYNGLLRTIADIDPDVIVTNAFSMATTKLWLRSWFMKTRYIIWSGAVERKGETDSWWRKIQRRLLVGRASGLIAYGSRARDYLVFLGADPGKIEIGINTVDVDYFSAEPERPETTEGGDKGTRRLLYIGQLTQGKRLDLLFSAMLELKKSGRDFILDVVGDGPEMIFLKSLSEDMGLSSLVRFQGYKQKQEIRGFLANSDCFLFPTDYDIWGLVLVEAMAAGCACISSIHAGATSDLIEDGVTGFAMDFTETGKVADKISWVLDHPEDSKVIGENARRFIAERASLKASSAGFVRSMVAALATT